VIKCVRCDKEAEYVYVYPLAVGVATQARGGSFCSECLRVVKEEEKSSFQRQREFYDGLEASRDEFVRKVFSGESAK